MCVLDFTEDAEIQLEATCREISNRVNRMRKEAKLNPDDPVDMWAAVVDPKKDVKLKAALSEKGEFIDQLLRRRLFPCSLLQGHEVSVFEQICEVNDEKLKICFTDTANSILPKSSDGGSPFEGDWKPKAGTIADRVDQFPGSSGWARINMKDHGSGRDYTGLFEWSLELCYDGWEEPYEDWLEAEEERKRKQEEEENTPWCTDATTSPTSAPSAQPPVDPPTSAPSAQPPMNPCTNMEDFAVGGKKKKNCKWVKDKPLQRCQLKDASGLKAKDACPMACDRRCSCKNFRSSFKFGESGRTSCKKIKPRKGDCLKNAGQKGIAADFCPLKCKDCYRHRT